MAKAQPFSVRFSERVDAFMEAEARRLKRSKSSIVEELAEEVSKLRRFPRIRIAQGIAGTRHARIVGGMKIWALCELLDLYKSEEAFREDYPHVPVWHIELARAYRAEYPDEIAERIAWNNRSPEEFAAEFPFVVLSH